jgi:hypothetical protein
VGKPYTSITTTACQKLVKSTDYSYDKWTQVRVHQDPYLKTEKLKCEAIPIPIIETGGTPQRKPRFKTKRIRKRVTGSMAMFRTATETADTGTVNLDCDG